MRGRRPKPTALKKVEGNRGRRPLNDREPTAPAGLETLRPPKSISTGGKREWFREASQLHRVGVLTKLDTIAFELLCELLAELREVDELIRAEAHRNAGRTRYAVKGSKKQPMVNPLLRVRRDLRTQVSRLLIEFGLTPSSRSRVTARPPGEGQGDPAAEFFN